MTAISALIEIEEEVCASMDVSREELHSRNRLERIVRARQIVYYLAHRLVHMTQEQIGQLLDRDHAAVCCGEKRIRGLIDVDKPFAALVEQIRLRAEARLQEKPEHDNPAGH